MIIAATGHRPDKLGGYDPKILSRLTDFAAAFIVRLAPDYVISGMAQGWDTAVALAVIQLGGIRLITAEPFLGQASKWPLEARQRHQFILSHATGRYVVCDGGYAAWKMQRRNEWMVDRAYFMLALWDGSPGGTANCISYAHKKQRFINNLWSEWRSRENL